MGIGGINDHAGFFPDYRVPSVSDVSLKEVRLKEARTGENSIAAEAIHETPFIENTPAGPRKDAPLEDISITFNKLEDFGFIGQDSDIRSLDVEQAISDMKKDQVLQQYHYFVGSARNLIVDNADGIVFPKF